MRKKDGVEGTTLSSTKQYIRCFNKREAAGKLQGFNHRGRSKLIFGGAGGVRGDRGGRDGERSWQCPGAFVKFQKF